MPESPRCSKTAYTEEITLTRALSRWLIDTDKEEDGMRVLADLHGGDLDHPKAVAEFEEIKEKVREERDSGEGRSYRVMWKKYKRRVLLAMSSQAFAQLRESSKRLVGSADKLSS
ncbi:hypothetical protein DXG03_008978 [Asterophora parasitica]|uniref:Uncharacterized protein n=1 Tax=Asterophora parasitica TaxID=117018 RepID=A0A9P7KG96_9AGAR|nr:hypothetical protein DXG03_008978 [Asterophora parasitica]